MVMKIPVMSDFMTLIKSHHSTQKATFVSQHKTSAQVKNQEVSEYIAQFPDEVQKSLEKIRASIFKLAPEVDESMAYKMPAYKLNKKPLVYFAAFKNHIGFYATPTGHEAFVIQLSKYKQGRGSVQFPLNQAIPFDLIEEIVAFRIEENLKSKK